MTFKLSAEIARLRLAFDNPRLPIVPLDAAECHRIASKLIEFELEADRLMQAMLDAHLREGGLFVENIDLRAENDRLARENQALQRRLADRSAEILPFRPRHRPVAASTNPGGDAA